jgi:NAD-dependent SIR2 family protein deacetylase
MKHLRDDNNRYMGICGAGYPWPSTISLADNLNEITCRKCLKIAEKIPPPGHIQKQLESISQSLSQCNDCGALIIRNDAVGTQHAKWHEDIELAISSLKNLIVTIGESRR